MTAPRDDEEWRKKITAALLAGNSIMFFDNVEHTLSSPHLAAALTTPVWSDRILGRSEMAQDLPQRATWMATGNNLSVGGDLARRSYWTRLDARMARPWQRRGFRHPDLLPYVLANRGKLLAAAFTLARAWFVAGRPQADVPILGGFEDWTRVVGGILDFAGIEGFLDNLEQLYEQVDQEEMAWERFLSSWFDTYGNQPKTVADVTADLKRDGSALRAVVPSALAEALAGKGSFERKLGRALGKRSDGVFGKHRVERVGTDPDLNVERWRVIDAPPRVGGFTGFPGFSAPERGSDAPSDVGGSEQRPGGNPETRTPGGEPEEDGNNVDDWEDCS
jgi:hypothetical protein